MKYSFATIFSLLIAAVVFTAPSNLFFVLNENVGYANGMRVDYLMPKMYLSDIFILLTIASVLLKNRYSFSVKKILRSNLKILVTLGLLFLCSLIFSTHRIAALYGIVKILEFSLFTYGIWNLKHLINKKIILIAIATALSIQTTVALLQFWLQHSVTPYWLFGETQYSSSSFAIARATLFAQEKILAYGTTAHPNVLAGTVVLFSLLAAQLQKTVRVPLLLNVLVILFLTQSLSALLALLIAISVLVFEKYVHNKVQVKKNIFILGLTLFISVPLVNWLATMFMTNNFSVFRRHELNFSALKMFMSHPLIGVGIGNFTANLEKYLGNKELVRFIQPAHHVGVLWLAETGLLGTSLIIQLLLQLKKYVAQISLLTLTILPIISLDHYTVTIQTGTISVLLFLVFIHQDSFAKKVSKIISWPVRKF